MPTVITKTILPTIIKRLEAGAALIAESRALGFTHNGPLRSALREFLGMDKYDVLMAAKRPVARVGSTGRRSTDTTPVPRPDDAGLPIVTSMKTCDGWSWRHVPEHEPIPRRVDIKDRGAMTIMDAGDDIIVVKAPDGTEYTQAFDHERADLLRENTVSPQLPPLRLVRWKNSVRRQSVEKGMQKAGKLQEHVEAQRMKGKKSAPVALDMNKAPDIKFAVAALAAGIVEPAPVAQAKPAAVKAKAKPAAKPAAVKAKAKPAAKKAVKAKPAAKKVVKAKSSKRSK